MPIYLLGARTPRVEIPNEPLAISIAGQVGGAALYIAARLNHVFHAAGLSPAWQFRLLPGRLQVSRRLMRQPYWVPLSSIKWGGRPRGGERRKGKGLGQGIVFDGDWDIEDKREIDAYLNDYIYSKAVFQIFRDAMDYRETDQYKEMMQFVESGQTSVWQVRGCRSESDVNKYFADMRKTFDALSEHSYLSQQELGSDEWFDEIASIADVGTPAVTPGPVAANLIVGRQNTRLDDDLDCIARRQVPIVITSVGNPAPVIAPLHEAGSLVVVDVVSLEHAHKALAAGADGLILLSAGAGGHTGWANPLAFVRAVRSFYDGPLAVAGGMSDGAALWAAVTAARVEVGDGR